jgi:hypothetical protein
MLLLLCPLAACQTQKSSNPLSPSVAGPIAGVNITPPVLLRPAQGTKLKDSDQPIQLVVQNAATTGVRPLTYRFEVSTDSSFGSTLFARSGIAPGANNQTSVQLDTLPLNQNYYWRARAEDGANTGSYASAAFFVFPHASINPPVAIAPVGNVLVGNTTPVLQVQNAATAGPVGTLSYEFQVAKDQGFTQLAAAGAIVEGAGGTTTFTSGALSGALTYFWRARASDGETTSAWATTQAFKTPNAPSPSPSPAPTGGPCTSTDPLAIITCERDKYTHMTADQELSFIKATAHDFNANGVSSGPFGVLRKSGGSNCGGYSCDTLCAGQGTSQRQWDILGDADPWPGGGAQTPSWGPPATYPNIRADTCDIQ